MSQMNGGFADGPGEAKVSNTSRAVLLLAVAVVLFITLLHELDNSPSLAAANAKSSTPTTTAAPVTTSTTLAARTPADVKVLVANGIGTAGVASKVASRLQPIGYQLAKPGNTTDKQVNSVVEYTAGYQAEAQAVATSLGLAASAVQALPTPSPVADLQASNVLVIVGNDLANATSPTSVAGAAGSTTATTLGTTATTSANITGPLTTATTNTTLSTTATTAAR